MSEITPETRAGFFHITQRLWRHAKRYRTLFVIAVAATVILNFASLIRPHLIKILTDDVLNGSSLDGKTTLLAELLAGLLGATLVKGLFTYVQGITLNLASHGTVRDLREAVYEHLQHLPIRWYDRNRVGDLMVRFTDDLRITIEFMTSGLTVATNDTLILITSLAWMVAKDWQLTVVGMIVSPLAAFAVRRYSERLSHATHTAQEKLSDLSSMVKETVDGIRVVKSFNQEVREGDRFSLQNNESFRWAMRIVQITATQSPIMEVLATGGIALVLYYCALKIIQGTLTFGDLLAFWGYMLMATTPITRLPQTATNIHRGRTALGRLLAIRDEPTEEEVADEARRVFAQAKTVEGSSDSPTEGRGVFACAKTVKGSADSPTEGRGVYAEPAQPVIELPPVKGAVAIRGVRFRYDATREEALRGVDLDIAAGEHVAIVGRNGAGKTTLVNLIPRFYELQEGDVRIDGISVRNVSLASLRRQIGLVPQDTFLFSGTIRENIRYGREGATDEEVEEAGRLAGVDAFVRGFDKAWGAELSERGGGLSGGQKQRVAVARMLLKDPPIVILDEATSAMDPDAEKAFQETLELVGRGRTVISIAHRMIASRGADRIVAMEQGQVVEMGTHDALLERRGLYWQLYSSVLEPR